MFSRILIPSVCLTILLGLLILVNPITPQPAPPARDPFLLKVALLQMRPDGNNQSANMDKAEKFCRQAAAQGADIALMPEMWNIGYTGFDPKKEGAREEFCRQSVATDHPSIQRFAKLADELDMAIAVTYEQAWDPAPRNVVTLFDRHGKKLFTYAKVHTCDFEAREAAMTPGRDFFVADLDTRCGPIKIGTMICYDREQPESARILMLKGAELILTPNACGIDELRLIQFRVRAYENACGVAMANYPAPNENGRSVAFNADGECLVQAEKDEGIFVAAFNLDDLRRYRQNTIWGNAFRRPHRYNALTSTEKDDTWKRNNAFGKPFNAAER